MPPAHPAGGVTLWRVFPWDRGAAPGAPFSPSFIPGRELQGRSRFDLPDLTPVLYLAESPVHAYAESLRPFPTQILLRAHLRAHRLPLALVDVTMPADLIRALPDFTEGADLVRFGVKPDVLNYPPPRFRETQAVARRVWEAGAAGFRWWSAIDGEHHSTVLFMARIPADALAFGTPVRADLHDPIARQAATLVHMRLRPSRKKHAGE